MHRSQVGAALTKSAEKKIQTDALPKKWFEAIKRERDRNPLSSEERETLCARLRISERLSDVTDDELYHGYILAVV